MSQNDTISENVKKIHTWSNGYGLYVTKEAKLLGWNQHTYVKLSVVKDGNKKKVVVEKIEI